MARAIVGANWGDEGKGKITDMLAQESDIVIRFQGGSNAGHTIINNYGRFAMHLLPSGVFSQHTVNIIGNGVALNIPYFVKELNSLTEQGVPKPNIMVSDRAQILMPYHVALDTYEEERLAGKSFGSTRSGIAPFYSDKYAKIGFQVSELFGEAMKKIKGAYSLVVMSPRKLIGARDPYGFRPLCIGKRGNAYILASESCALDTIGAEFVRDVEPGEIVTITQKGIESNRSMCIPKEQHARCIFEYIYFARPDAYIDGVSVYESRLIAGRSLAKHHPVDADLVVGVPESGNVAAMGYAMESGIPYGMAFVKNSYVGRTFIKPKQSSRESSVRIKLNVLTEAVKGKRVIMIDDSIVRGTTSDRIVGMLREAGAKEVHVRISSPPFLHPCYFGTDIPSEDQLIAHNRSIDEICKIIGADSLAYLDEECLYEMSKGLGICTGCFNGKYPLDPPTEDIRGDYQK